MGMAVATLADTHGLVTQPGTQLWASSEGLGWRSVFATAQREAPFEERCRGIADHLIVVHLSGPVRVCRTLEGRQESRLVPPGGVFIMPGDAEFGVRLEGHLDTVHFYIQRDVVDEIADLFELGHERARIIPRLGSPDPLLEQVALELREQLYDAGPLTSLYVDHLARTAAARLVRKHSTASLRTEPSGRAGGLTREQLGRAIDYLDAHLDQDPTLPELAAATGLSPVYFARQFRRATGVAPHQYLLRARVVRAKHLLAATDLRIATIALDCGFCHQEHLTRAFRKQCGITPAAYRAAVKA